MNMIKKTRDKSCPLERNQVRGCEKSCKGHATSTIRKNDSM